MQVDEGEQVRNVSMVFNSSSGFYWKHVCLIGDKTVTLFLYKSVVTISTRLHYYCTTAR